MKNFTKQNFKTNPLWIWLLIMTFMLLAGAGNAWGATRTFSSGDYIYIKNFKPNGWGDYWFTSTQKYGWAHMWGGTAGDNDYSFELYSGTAGSSGAIYRAKITKAGTYTKIIFTRNTSNNGVWNDKTNQTGDLDLPSTGNRLTALNNGEDSPYNPVWDTYNPCITTTLTWNNESSIKTSMKKGETQTVSVTLSPSGAGTPTFTTSDDSKVSLSGSGSSRTLTAEAAGSATITASFAEANGYCGSSIAKTITVTDPCATKYYIAGTLPGASWTASEHLEMTCVDGLRSYTFTDAGKGEYKFKITNNTWGSSWNTLNTSKSSGVTCKSNDGDGNMVFETPAEGNITIYFDDNKKAWVTWEANCTKPDKPSIELSTNSICKEDNTSVTITVTGEAETFKLYTVTNNGNLLKETKNTKTFTVEPTQTTTYVVKALNGTCESDFSDPITVTVSEKPSITLNPTSTAICKGDELDLSEFATSTVNLTWWNGETQITSPVSPETNTTYTVKAINGACTVTKDFPVTVNALPSAPQFEAAPSYCAGDEITLPTEDKAKNSVTWYKQDGSDAGTPLNTAGTYTYKAKATNTNGCVSSDYGTYSYKVKSLATASNYELTNTTADYTGRAVTLQISDVIVKNDAAAVSSIYFKQDAINVGTYKVYVTTEANDTYCAATELEIGTFTINKANQIDNFAITNDQTKYCGLPSEAITLTSTGGSTNETVIYESGDNTVATIDGSELSVLKEGTVTITATRPGGDNYNNITATKQFTFYKAPEKPTASQVDKIQLCKGEPTNGKIVINNVEPGNELDKYEYTINNGATGNAKDGFVISNAGDYIVTVTRNVDGCSMSTNSDPITVGTDDNTPAITDVKISGDAEVCINTGTTLTASVTAENYDNIAYLWSNGATEQSIQTGDLAENKTFTVTVTATKNETCPVTDVKDFNIQVKPISEPTIQATAISGINSIELSIKVQNAGCAKNYTLGYRIKQFNDAEFGANQIIANATSENKVTTQIEGLVTGVEYIIEAYIINGYNNNELFYAEPITCTVLASEDCVNPSADYIEILCRRTDNQESTDADRDMHCYAWDPNTNKTYLGGWPGVKTDDGDFEYKGKKYAVWQIKTNSDIYIIFSNGNDSQKTGDIKGPNDAGLKKGYRYVYTLSSDYKTATLYEEPSIIFAPEVKTLSATYARQSDNSLKVTVTGKIMKKGCVEISSYGFQYKKDSGDYTNVDVCSSDCDQEAGFIFTKDITLAAGKYGEYTFRARLINENSSKVYGEKITIYYSESDVLIAAVGDDKIVTNKSGVYYDFVGLYVKNVMLPEGAKVKSYQWYKGDALYNGGNVTVADRGVSAANNNIRPSEAGLYKCVVTLDNNQTLTSNVINVTATDTYNDKVNASNRNLPVISVRTNEAFPTCKTAGTEGKYPSTNIEGWKEKRSVDVKIFNADGTLYYDRKARMNYRGSSSLNFNKKSYAFCPGEENCGQEKDKTPDYVTTTKMNLFGLSDGAKDKDWVLYAAAADPTLMRNRIVFDTYADMTGKWGVDSKYVELVIDGVYQGVYVLMDKITNNEKRVNITDPNGFIVKFDKTDIADREADLLDAGQEVGDEKTFQTKRTGRVGIQTYNTFVDQLFEIEYPEKKKVVKNGGDWSTTLSAIKQKFEEFETALADGDYIKVRSLIDYESWADWFIINEFTKNVDAYRASCVFVYNGNKIEAQPLWDQELSFNNAAGASIGKKGADKTTGLLIENNGVYTDCFPAPFWWTGTQSSFNNCGTNNGESTISSEKIQNYLLKDECFVATIKDRWDTHTEKGGALHKDQLMAKYSALLTELGAAKDREITKWPSNHREADACGGSGTGYNDVTFDVSETALINWINKDLVEISSESESASRASNLNYLIENMEGEPLRFDLTLNPASGVTTPWIPITVTVEVPDGYEYTYDDSSIKANEGVIIKSTTNKHSYTFPRPENWNTGNQGEGNEIEPLFYEVNVSLNIETTETASCGESKFETSKTAIISLQDEGDDLCNYAD